MVADRFQQVISQLFSQRIVRLGGAVDDDMGDEVRITVVAAGFERWDEAGSGRRPSSTSRSSETESSVVDVFKDDAGDDGDDLFEGDDDFDVPSFLK